jgi:tricorn protease
MLQSPSMDVHLMRFPDVYGDKIVFTYASDLWLVGTEGGIARRLTSHPGMEYRAKFSPDGKWIAFSGQYDGDTDVYVLPSDGGEPKRLTFNSGNDLVGEWTPDGRIAFTSPRENQRQVNGVWFVSPNGGIPQKSDVHEAADISFSADGRTMAYNRVPSHQFNWRRYRGGTQGRVSFWDFSTKQYTEMATGREQNYFPMWVGDSVYYTSDINQGTLNLYKYDPRSKGKTQITRYSDADIRWPSTDGKTVVFERNGRMYTLNVANNNVTEVKAKVVSDQLKRRPTFRNVSQWIDGISLSPSAARLAITARGDVFSVPATNGATRNLTMTQDAREEMPVWSPDGQEILFLSDKSGERKIYRVPQMGGEWKPVVTPDGESIAGLTYSPDGKKIGYMTDDLEMFIVDIESGKRTLVFKDPQGIAGADWSKDGKWIAYIKTQPNLFGAIYLYDVENDKHVQVTDGYYNDTAVTFDLNGKYLYFVSQRTFGFAPGDFEIGLQQESTQRVYVMTLKADLPDPMEKDEDEEPVKASGEAAAAGGAEAKPVVPAIDFDGLGRRVIALPLPPGSYPFVVGATNGVFTYSEGTLLKFDFATKQPQPIVSGSTSFDFTPDRTKMVYSFGPNYGISPVRPGIQPGAGRVDMADVTMWIDPVKEWKGIMRDAWRYERDNFYDKGMLGLDWKAIGEKYFAMVDGAGDRSDLNYIMGMMIGELGTGHAYNGGGDFGQPIGNPNTGMLGVDYSTVGESVVIKKVYKGLNFESPRRGPLGAPGVSVKDGDYLLEIDGVAVTSKIDPNSLLIGKAGKKVRIKVASSASGIDAREYVVTPVSIETQLRYGDWVESNRKRVEEMSGGKIGYVHVPNTAVEGILEFMKGYYGQSDKEAFIVDERYNGGGFIPTFFGERLLRQVVTAIQQRHAEDVVYPPQTWDGPKVMLINRYAGSGGDHFPWLFRHLGIGPLIGTRTWGGLVGISGGRNLVDGGSVTAPEFALYDVRTGEMIAENTGIDPDIEVDDTPDLVSQGRDPELETAVKYLMDQLAKNPRKPYARPKFLSGGN